MIVNSRIIAFVIVKRTRASSHVSCAIEAIKLLLLKIIIRNKSAFEIRFEINLNQIQEERLYLRNTCPRK